MLALTNDLKKILNLNKIESDKLSMDNLGMIGEKKMVEEIIRGTKSEAFLGPGDDAAAISIGDECIVASTDIISQKTHTSPEMSYYDIGWFAAAVNYSDVAAMGAKPVGILTSMMLSRDMLYDDFKEIMRGIKECSEAVGGEILGGDTKEGDGIVISGTALGIINKNRLLKRSGAKDGDLIAVTGQMGTAAAGYLASLQNIDAPEEKRALYAPVPRTKEGEILSKSGFATSCMDVTDGLAYSICEIARQSGVHFEIEWDKIPMSDKTKKLIAETGSSDIETILYFGGEYELVFTFDPKGEKYLSEALGDKFYIIGKAEGKKNILLKDRNCIELEHRGWEHFRY